MVAKISNFNPISRYYGCHLFFFNYWKYKYFRKLNTHFENLYLFLLFLKIREVCQFIKKNKKSKNLKKDD